jgi:hypothetical protein
LKQIQTKYKKIQLLRISRQKAKGRFLELRSLSLKNPERPIEDTLILKLNNKDFIITPLGLFKTFDNDSIQLETELIVNRAFLYETKKYFYVFFTDTDHDGATSWIQKISKSPLKTEYVEQIQGFNLGQPIIVGETAYVSAIGFIGKIDMKSGMYDWKHHNLYDNENYSFNSFDTVLINKTQIEFVSENYRSKKVDKVLVDNQSGEIEEIIK